MESISIAISYVKIYIDTRTVRESPKAWARWCDFTAANGPLYPLGRSLPFLPSGLHVFPCGIGNQQKVIKFTGAAQPVAAIDDHTFAIDVFSHVAQQKRGEAGQFFVLAESLHRV